MTETIASIIISVGLGAAAGLIARSIYENVTTKKKKWSGEERREGVITVEQYQELKKTIDDQGKELKDILDMVSRFDERFKLLMPQIKELFTRLNAMKV